MQDVDVSKQVQQMVQFIRQEAEEKANEIAVAAEEVCDRPCSSAVAVVELAQRLRERPFFIWTFDVQLGAASKWSLLVGSVLKRPV